jgi:hypothetical protein
MDTECYRFKVGTFDCVAVKDLMTTYTASRFFTNAPEELLEQVLQAFHFCPFPSLGHVVRRGRGWQWRPIGMTA